MNMSLMFTRVEQCSADELKQLLEYIISQMPNLDVIDVLKQCAHADVKSALGLEWSREDG